MFPTAPLVFLLVASVRGSDNLGDLPIENPDLLGGDILGLDDIESRNAIVSEQKLWPGGVVPFEVDPGVTEGPGKTVFGFILNMGIDMLHKHTCIRFVNRTTEKDYVRIIPGQGCYSHVGRTGGQQPLSLGNGCNWPGTVAHELVHAIGFYHEQNRSDRDEYINIHWENIKDGNEDQFFLLKPEQNRLLTDFDYDSLMLYGSLTFSKDKRARLKTMTGKDGRWLKDVNSKNKLSPSDIKRINTLYKCKV